MHNFASASWEEDVARARDCLSVLAFCGTEDRVATHFHVKLDSLLQRVLSESSSSSAEQTPPQAEFQQDTTQPNEPFSPMEVETNEDQGNDDRGNDDQAYLANHAYHLHIPGHANKCQVQFSYLILMMLSQPFGDPDTREAAELNLKENWLNDPSRYEYPQMAERLDWDIEKSRLFQWDLSKLRFPTLDILEHTGPLGSAPSRFIGSNAPSGWVSAANFTTPRDR